MKPPFHIVLKGCLSAAVVLSAFLMSTVPAVGQDLHIAANLYVNNVSVHVGGSVNNTGLLVNEGDITFSRHWENQGEYDGTGTVGADGAETQYIAHNGGDMQSLAMTGGGPKYVRGTLHVTGRFQLTDGIILVSPADALVLRNGTTIVGGSSRSFVEGPLTVEGTGDHFFPVGKDGTYAPLELLDVQGQSPIFSIEAFDGVHVPVVQGIDVRDNLYWQRSDVAGTFGEAHIRIPYDPVRFPDPESIVLLAGTDWDHAFDPVATWRNPAAGNSVTSTTGVRAPLVLLGEYSKESRNSFYFPTALSPNAQHPDNRFVKVFGRQLDAEGFSFSVFDRGGKLVYASTSLQVMSTQGWDGRALNGRHLVSGAYPYHLIVRDKKGKRIEQKGVINIVY